MGTLFRFSFGSSTSPLIIVAGLEKKCSSCVSKCPYVITDAIELPLLPARPALC
ncbi:uncharacterized protein METZ01_LOCUS471873 [marine metagenome]|uniref:Uncharacterized protein n=1 Tax=marine metagenome TaxID=408172 RepID=A0A383BGL7_9ZZZZ